MPGFLEGLEPNFGEGPKPEQARSLGPYFLGPDPSLIILVLFGWRPVWWLLKTATRQPQRPPVGWPICHKSTDPQYTQEEEEGKKDHQHGPYASGLCFAAIQNTMFLLRFKMSRSLLIFSVIFRYTQKWLFGSFWHFWRKFWFWHFRKWHFWKCMSR